MKEWEKLYQIVDNLSKAINNLSSVIYDVVKTTKEIPELYSIAKKLVDHEKELRRLKREIEDIAEDYWRRDTESRF